MLEENSVVLIEYISGLGANHENKISYLKVLMSLVLASLSEETEEEEEKSAASSPPLREQKPYM
jgi:hypothetical protein